ncbi:XdhC/CoxI family protein [Rufibacter immobilis]|uniref:XdhC/CoxI family protein n=1 Tax=Rufibacter immobilis TaxID=1348778 RepID=A0A3M9MQL2_9BACT|nr:XdhC/CoxI family protein [Rufibacter immobilis]RNI27796.1 XdhC/CoxI family protein [Rufibacter immobilis]
MKEIQDIVRAFAQHEKAGKQTALATVVHVEGSSYRRPGARMLVSEDGQLTGAISGGCLEGDALRKARLAMAQGKPSLVKYDTMDDDDAKLGVGLGCNGIIHILIEPIDTTQPTHPLALLQKVLERRRTAVVVTLFSLQDRKAPQPGTCLLYLPHHQNCQPFQHFLSPALLAQLEPHVLQAAAQEESQTVELEEQGQTYTAFVEVLKPAPALVICGAGNDVLPLVHLAQVLGWHTTVVDGRANYATAERFPTAQQVIVSKPEQVLSQVAVDQHTVFLLLTHNYNYDIAMLRQLLPLQLKYVGVLGPKKKTERLLEELQQEGMYLDSEQRQSLFGPVGLDIGAETSEEIALSILAEIKAVFAQRGGGNLREKALPIHAAQETSAAPFPS